MFRSDERARPVHSGLLALACALGASLAAFGQSTERNVAYSFHRDSAAYGSTPDGATFYPPDSPIVCDVASVTVSDGVLRSNGRPRGINVAPLACDGRYLFGRSDDDHLYRSDDGVSWEPLNPLHTSRIWCLADGTLICASPQPQANERQAVYRSVDQGETWAPARFADSQQPFRLLTPGAQLQYWSVHQALNGTILMVEYRVPDGGRYIYRSTDSGATWQVVYDVGVGNIYHYHAVGKHEGLNRWIAATGDPQWAQRMPVSDDDGLTWHDYLVPPGSRRARPIALTDYGHPTRILFGSDEYWQLGWLDVSDGPTGRTIVSLATQLNPAPTKCYVWDLFTYDGLYFASSWDYGAGQRNPVILVSPDLAHWTTFHRFTNGEYGAYHFTGFLNRKLHLLVNAGTSFRHLAVSPPRARVDQGWLVAGAATNLLNSDLSNAAATAGWSNDSQIIAGSRGTFEVTTNVAHSGAGCLHFTRGDGGGMVLSTPTTAVTCSRAVQLRVWVRGLANTSAVANVVDGEVSSTVVGFEPMQDRWLEVVCPVLNISGEHSVGLRFTCQPNSDQSLELFIDSLQLEQIPATPWQPAETPRAPTYGEAVQPVGAGWTNVFSIQPDVLADDLASLTTLLIKSYEIDPQTRLDLTYAPVEGAFKLQATIAGVPQRALTIDRQHFHRKHQIRFAVRCQAGYCYGLSVGNGQPPRHVTGSLSVALGTSVTMRAGSADPAARVLPYVLYNDQWFDSCLSDGQIADAMNDLNDGAWTAGDANCDGRLDAADLPALELQITDPDAYHAQYPDCPSANADINADGVSDAADLAALSEILLGPPLVPGDMNCDGRVDEDDVAPFELALAGQAGYEAAFPTCRWLNADCDGDGLVNADDEEAFHVLVYGPPPKKGDLNCDDEVDFDDISPFVKALGGPAAYYAAFPACDIALADCNCDGNVDFDDIRSFVHCLMGKPDCH